jgi:ribosomal protein L30E
MTTITQVLKDTKKMVFGKAQVMKLLQEGKLTEVFLAENSIEKQSIGNIAKLSETKVNILKQNNDELGALCKKPFAIAIIGLKK